MDPTSDTAGTPTVTSTMTPATSTPGKGSYKKRKQNKAKSEQNKPRKLEPYRPKPPPRVIQSPISLNSPKQSFNLSGIVTPHEVSTSNVSHIPDTKMTSISTINEESSWDIEESGTERTSNMAVKDVKEPLNDNESSYIVDYMPTDDDIDSLANIDGNYPSLFPYLGPNYFGTWLESQFTTIFPSGTHTA